jgi:hypothetical protein
VAQRALDFLSPDSNRIEGGRPPEFDPPLYRKRVGARFWTVSALKSGFLAGITSPRMEHLWSRAVATSGNRWQMPALENPRKQGETVDGKEGVGGSSPPEGFAKSLQVARFVFRSTCRFSRVRLVWSRLWSFQVENAPHSGVPRARATSLTSRQRAIVVG